MKYKFYIRELLGLALIVSVVLGILGVILDLFALNALWEHQDAIAYAFFHKSIYFIVFLVPPVFLWRLINRSDLLTATQNYIAMKLAAEKQAKQP